MRDFSSPAVVDSSLSLQGTQLQPCWETKSLYAVVGGVTVRAAPGTLEVGNLSVVSQEVGHLAGKEQRADRASVAGVSSAHV